MLFKWTPCRCRGADLSNFVEIRIINNKWIRIINKKWIWIINKKWIRILNHKWIRILNKKWIRVMNKWIRISNDKWTWIISVIISFLLICMKHRMFFLLLIYVILAKNMYLMWLYNVLSLYQILLKSTVYEIASQVKRPWKAMEYRQQFLLKEMKEMSGILRQCSAVAVKFTS